MRIERKWRTITFMLESYALESRVLETIRVRRLIEPGGRALCAVSGGSDSMALLALMLAVREKGGFAVEAAHFDHGMRGESARADAEFVRRMCEAWGVPCHMGAGDVPALAAQWKCSPEDAARRARYAFLDETAEKCGTDRIVLAHQREDQAETVLLHLTHGCGLDGLSGMRWRQGNRVRPLLDVSRGELREYLRARGIPWREDETNAQACCARNLLRLNVMPQLRLLNPRADEAICRAAEHAARAADEERRRAEERLSGCWRETPYGAFWRTDELAPETARRFCERAGVAALDEKQTERLCALAPGGETNLPGGVKAFRTRTRLHLIAREARYDAGGAPFETAPCAVEVRGDGIRCQAFDAKKLRGAVFRARRDGDVFAPLGMEGAQKLKKTLQDAGIDRPFRDLLPVLARGDRVLWTVGLKASREAAIDETTTCAVMVRFTGKLPWEL